MNIQKYNLFYELLNNQDQIYFKNNIIFMKIILLNTAKVTIDISYYKLDLHTHIQQQFGPCYYH